MKVVDFPIESAAAPALSLFVFFALGVFAGRVMAPWAQRRLRRLKAARADKKFEPIIANCKLPLSLLAMCAVWRLGLHLTDMNAEWRSFLIQPVRLVAGYSLILAFYRVLDIVEISISKTFLREKDTLNRQVVPYLKRALKILSAALVALMALQSAGFNVTALLAGLGLGGVAVALGARETLTDIFAGFALIADKPFSIGDWVEFKGIEGTVMDIGFRSTKIKTFYDSVITAPNSFIADSVIDNLGRRKARRTRFTLDLTYSSSPEEIEAFVKGIKQIIASNPCARKDYYQACFCGYGESGLKVMVNFFLKVRDWDEELLQKQNIYLEILRLAKATGVSFAFPSRTVEFRRADGAARKTAPLAAADLKAKALAFGPGGGAARPEGSGLFNEESQRP